MNAVAANAMAAKMTADHIAASACSGDKRKQKRKQIS